MAKVFALAADGTEECELLNVVDVLRRAGAEVAIVSADGPTVTGSHGVRLAADATIEALRPDRSDIIFVPGGMPGSKRLAATERLISALKAHNAAGGRIAAICAAPGLVLGMNGLLVGKKATCFPGFESYMQGATATGARVVTDGNITTARGLGCSIELGLELVRLLLGEAKAEDIKNKIQF